MKFRIAIVAVVVWHLGCVMMAAYKVERAFVFANKLQEGFDPFLVGSATDCRASYAESFINCLYRT